MKRIWILLVLLWPLATPIRHARSAAIGLTAPPVSMSRSVPNSILDRNGKIFQQPEVSENTCLVLVQDNSGSMKDNDPGFMRNTAARLSISILDEGDQVGIVRFSTNATKVTPDLVKLSTPQDKLKLIEQLGDVPPDGYTDIRSALKEALDLLQKANCTRRFILLLSDGQPELPGGVPRNYAKNTLDLVKNAGIPVLGIALTPSGESGLLYRLASATNPPGKVIPARTDSDLLDAYLEALAQLKDRTISGSGFSSSPGFTPLPLDPGLAQYVSRVTYIVSKPESVSAQLIAPGSEIISPDDPRLAFSYTDDPQFAAFTINSPAPRNWGFNLVGSGKVQARAILYSRLRVSIHQPGSYQPQGIALPIAASLVEEERSGDLTNLIGEVSFSALIIRPDSSQDALDQLFDDGTHGDLQANDGIFTNQYVKTDHIGEYQIIISGYMGMIPVSQSLRSLVIPFPQIIPISPAQPDFEFRGKPMNLKMKLEGGDPPILDTGAFIARVTGPGNSTTEIPLVHQSEDLPLTYSAQFAPTADGDYTIEYLPVNATYKGVPYALSARQKIKVRLVPAINVAETRLDLGVVEAYEFSHGLAVPLHMTSSSAATEPIDIKVAGLPGLNVSEITPASIPSGTSTVYVILQGNLTVRSYRATLLITAREGVDLVHREIPVMLTVYQPTLKIKPSALDLGEIRKDKFEHGQPAILNISSTSMKDEPLSLEWEGPENIHVEYKVVSLPAGKESQVEITIKGDALPQGSYQGRIRIISREGVQVVPNSIKVKLTVVPVPFCSRWCLPIGGTGVVIAFTATAILSALGSRDRVSGSLKPIRAPIGQSVPGTILLSSTTRFLHPGLAVIGSRSGAAIRLMGGNVRPKHACIRSTRSFVLERIGKPPRNVRIEKRVNVVENLSDGVVKANNVSIPKGTRSVGLRSGTRIQIGDYEFQYHE